MSDYYILDEYWEWLHNYYPEYYDRVFNSNPYIDNPHIQQLRKELTERKGLRLTESEMIIVLAKLLPDIQHQGKFSRWDCTSPQFDMTLELKSRTRHFSTLGIEKDKWDILKTFNNPRYVISTPEGLYSFDVHKLDEPKWDWTYGPVSTEFGDGADGEWEWKWVGFYDVNDATDLTYLLDK